MPDHTSSKRPRDEDTTAGPDRPAKRRTTGHLSGERTTGHLGPERTTGHLGRERTTGHLTRDDSRPARRRRAVGSLEGSTRGSGGRRFTPSALQFEEAQKVAVEAAVAAEARAPPGAITFPAADHDVELGEFEKDDPILKMHPFFPREPFRGAIVGPMKRGKTSLMRALVEDFLDGVYDEVHLWNPNVLTDRGLKWLFKPNKDGDAFPIGNIHTAWRQTEIDDLLRNVRHKRAEDERAGRPANSQYRVLWIIDDSTSMDGSPMAQGDRSIVDTRHAGVTVVIATHRFNLLGTLPRGQMDWVVYFAGGNAKDDTLFMDELGQLDGIPRQAMKRVLARISACRKPFNYIVYDGAQSEGQKLRHGIGGPHVLAQY